MAEDFTDSRTTGLVEMVAQRPEGYPAAGLEKALARTYDMGRPAAKQLIRRAVAEGHLTYTQRFGTTRLERSFHHPVRISRNVWLCSPGAEKADSPDGIVVVLAPSCAFGDGRHASSRLAVAGLEYVWTQTGLWPSAEDAWLLDIGTGSGILALAGLKMGIRRAVGTDIDPSACFAARHNAMLNGVASRFDATIQPLDAVEREFAVVTANLRAPTLAKLAPLIAGRTAANGVFVMSGMKEDEWPDLRRRYHQEGFARLWHRCEAGWAAAAFVKKHVCANPQAACGGGARQP